MPESSAASRPPLEGRSTLTCPNCGRTEELVTPTDSCLFFHECSDCGALLRPLPRGCCVYCSYGSVKCPPMQAEGGACCAANRS